MLKYAQIIDEQTKRCDVGTGSAVEYYKSIGMTEQDVEQAYDGQWYIAGYAPEAPAATHDDIKAQRQIRFTEEADPIRYEYDEALARGEEAAEELKAAWLAKKDEIRADLPYPDEANNEIERSDNNTGVNSGG